MRFTSLLSIPVLCFMPFVTLAEAISLLGQKSEIPTRALLSPLRAQVPPKPAPSLFIGRDSQGLFATPVPREPAIQKPTARASDIAKSAPRKLALAKRTSRGPAIATAAPAVYRGTDVEVIRQLIGQAESRRDGYDAVQHGARIKPPKRPTRMTISEIYRWIDATPGQPHAIGKYQFVPKTLKRVVTKLGLKKSSRFTPQTQDLLADVLLAEAGLHRFRAGKLKRTAFMNNLAKIWAGLPNSTGKSHYHGYAGNRATVTWARFDAAIRQIEPS